VTWTPRSRIRPPTPGLSFTETASEPWHVVAASTHPLADRGPIALRELGGDPLVLVTGEPDGARRLRQQLLALCHGAGFEPTLGPTLATLEDALIEISRSRACTFLRAANARARGGRPAPARRRAPRATGSRVAPIGNGGVSRTSRRR
jgi:DNA-binding transcriptional LysR family regulator